MNKSIFFLSDVHLGAENPEREKLKEDKLIVLLDKIKGEGGMLYLVGDLFEFWFEYENVIPKSHFRVLMKLKELVDSGIKIDYIVGNHDFWLGDFLPKHLGISISREPVEVVHQGKRMFIAHGDGFAKNDSGYRLLKKILRNRWNIFLYRQIPPDISYPLARLMARGSRDYVQKRDTGYLQDYEDFASEKIKQGFDAVILAHTHVPVLRDLGEGTYLNIGDFFRHFTYGKLQDGKLFLEHYS
jgi:UDP-2,3-diacylglucosamine hydrolase